MKLKDVQKLEEAIQVCANGHMQCAKQSQEANERIMRSEIEKYQKDQTEVIHKADQLANKFYKAWEALNDLMEVL